MRDLYEKALEMGQVQAVAVAKVEAALVALKQAIEGAAAHFAVRSSSQNAAAPGAQPQRSERR